MTYPYPPQQQRRSSRTAWIVGGIVIAVAVVVCGLAGVGALLLMASDDGQATPDGAGTGAPPSQAAANVRYADPADRCTLVDASMVDGWGGTLANTTAEDSDFPAELGGKVAGCAYDLRLDSLNTFKVFVAADGDAKGRYARMLEAYKYMTGGPINPVAGLGTAAAAHSQQGGDKRRIQSGIALYDNNLFLELRFIAGGTKDWDAAEVERHLADTARAIMAKLPRA